MYHPRSTVLIRLVTFTNGCLWTITFRMGKLLQRIKEAVCDHSTMKHYRFFDETRLMEVTEHYCPNCHKTTYTFEV